MIVFLLFIAVAQAQEKSAFEQSLVQDTGMKSEESWVQIKGKRYRKLEMRDGLYYLRFKDDQAKTADVFCAPPAGYKDEILIIEQPRDEVRPREFVQAFHEACKGKSKDPVSLKLDPQIGLGYPASHP